MDWSQLPASVNCHTTADMLSRALPALGLAVSTEGEVCRVEVGKEKLLEVARALKEHPDLRFTYFSFMTAIDRNEHFQLLYLLQSPETGASVWLRSRIAREGESVPSLAKVYAGANWHEREAFDMFGIVFEGHPDLRTILLPEGFQGHPLRKDWQPVENFLTDPLESPVSPRR